MPKTAKKRTPKKAAKKTTKARVDTTRRRAKLPLAPEELEPTAAPVDTSLAQFDEQGRRIV